MMQPYQEAGEEIERQGQRPGNIAKSVASLPFAYAGGTVLSRALPLLNKFVPPNLARKGLAKINPGFENFFKLAQENGITEDEALEFARSQINPETVEAAQSPKSKQPAPSEKNIIEMESPELHQFIDQEIKKGRPALHAGALAQNDKKFSNIVKKLEKQHKTPWSQILQAVYGMGEQAQPQQQMQQSAAQPQQQDKFKLIADAIGELRNLRTR